jgi:ribonuclease BN (tRNA processing enzyme)
VTPETCSALFSVEPSWWWSATQAAPMTCSKSRDADGLVIEGTYLDEDVEMARQFSHMTARGAAELAKKPGLSN